MPDGRTPRFSVESIRRVQSFNWFERFFQGLVLVFVLVPFAAIRFLVDVVNRWQRLLRPINRGLYNLSSNLDKSAPTANGFMSWLSATLSLLLHYIDLIFILVALNVLYRHGDTGAAIFMLVMVLLNHYLMAVIMFMELDYDDFADRDHPADFAIFLRRQLDVVFWDTQLYASAIHSNIMLDGLTQMLLKGYEESRVALQALLLSAPLSILLIVERSASLPQWKQKLQQDLQQFKDIKDLRGLRGQLHNDEALLVAAMAFSILNTLEKLVRLSMVNPQTQGDLLGFPLLYVRSNAARLPGTVVRDWLRRCEMMLYKQDDCLILKELFSHYTFPLKGEFLELADCHKAALVRKALTTFNAPVKRVSRLERFRLIEETTIKEFNANGIRPGRLLSQLLGDVLLETAGFQTVVLSNNELEDPMVCDFLLALKHNQECTVSKLDLSNNRMSEEGCEALHDLLIDNATLTWISLQNNPLSTAGVKRIAESFRINSILRYLDLSSCEMGAEAAAAIAGVMKANASLHHLNLSDTKIGREGCAAIAKALKNNNGLRELKLAGTAFDDAAAEALGVSLLTNKSLDQLDISRTEIGEAGARALVDALQQNNTLQEIAIIGCKRLDTSWQHLLSAAISATGKQRMLGGPPLPRQSKS